MNKKIKNIVLATLHLFEIDNVFNYVPDFELHDNKFNLSVEEMRQIRDVIQNEKFIKEK